MGLYYRSSQLRFVLAPGPTLASQTLVPKGTSLNHIEVCPHGGAIVEHMSEAIAQHGGCALIVDYGEDCSKRHTLRVSWIAIGPLSVGDYLGVQSPRDWRSRVACQC